MNSEPRPIVKLGKEKSTSSAFVTVITRSYLPFARTWAASIRQFHDVALYVVCVDDPTGFFDPGNEVFTVLTVSEIVPASDQRLLFYYTAFEACNAARAYAHKYMLEQTAHERWIYLDADIVVLHSLDEALGAVDAPFTGAVTPHCINAASPGQLDPYDTMLLKFGIFNSGFLGLRRSAEAARFVEWLVERLRSLCFFLYRDTFVDQLWLNFVPVLFPSFHIWAHPGANVAYWNLHERSITRGANGLEANGQPLLFLHFSRWQQEQPGAWLQGRRPVAGTDAQLLKQLGDDYAAAVEEAGYSKSKAWPYGYSTFRNGRLITGEMRRHFYQQLFDGSAAMGNPFEHPEWFSSRFERAAAIRRFKDLIKSRLGRFAVDHSG